MSDQSERYQTFLRSLDNDELIQHINTISQTQRENGALEEIDGEIKASSTPRDGKLAGIENLVFRSFTSVSSDPFDDGLDQMLVELDQDKRPEEQETKSLEGVQLLDFNDEDSVSEEDEYDVGEVHQFGDYTSYFHNKHAKQQQKDEEYRKWDAERRKISGDDSVPNPIFKGCVIHVNGFTNPSISEIHRLVILHGGKFLSYLVNKGSATHIICDKLTPRKSIEFKNYKVVKAQWISESVAKGELLDWKDYRLLSDIEYGQQRLGFTSNNHNNKSVDDDSKEQTELNEEDDDMDILKPLTQSEPREEIQEYLTQKKENIDRLNESKDVDPKFDAKHPDFLKHFFAKSRLHHLSSWKADLRSKFLSRIVEDLASYKNNIKINENADDRVIFHIDFDCFFATASCLNYPKVDINKDPIAVSHGVRTSDVASCNYVARSFGVKNGMWMGRAKKLCPHLITLDYDFNSYESYSNKFYEYLISCRIFDSIFPVSIDEVLVDPTSYIKESGKNFIDAVDSLAEEIRSDIFKLTNCTVSVGASHNVLLAKLALRKAKPNGHFYLHKDIFSFLNTISIRELPGIGYSIEDRISSQLGKKNPTLEDLRKISRAKLEIDFGKKTGLKLFNYSRGVDDTSIKIDINNSEAVLGRKSVSVDVNYGIRFDTIEQVDAFLMNLSKELASRLGDLRVCGSSVTLRLAKRAPNAPRDPPKYLGMGVCDFVSKSTRLGIPTNDWGIIGSELKAILRMLNIPVIELRGISITMNKLENSDKLGNKQSRLQFPLITSNKSSKVPSIPLAENSNDKFRVQKNKKRDIRKVTLDEESIDWAVFEALPSEIKREIRRELTNRGIINRAPSSVSVTSKPSGELPGAKVYLQQLLPSQSSNMVKYTRVIESPKKAKAKKQRLSKSPSPVKIKKEAYNVYDYSSSFDSSVINELPSSIRNEVLKDVEYKKKIKKFSLEPLRDKIIKKHQSRVKAESTKITPSWILEQRKIFPSPLFLGKQSSFLEMKSHIEGWVSMSLKQGGPHVDDVQVFVDYLKSLLYQRNLNRCLTLISTVKSNLNFHESLAKLTTENQDTYLITEGMKDWNDQLEHNIIPPIKEYCDIHRLKFNV